MLAPDLPHEALEALGNAERRRILTLLSGGPRSVGDIAAGFDISRPAISRHLRMLERARLVRHDARGTRNLYRLDRAGIAATVSWLNDFWDEAETRLRLVAENLQDAPDRG
jgi:DNA-binding transcriptional ArsR family regulator